MVDAGYIPIAKFADLAGVSKQAIYKQVKNENSQIAPYVLREGKIIRIHKSALNDLYKVETTNSTETTPAESQISTETTPKVEIEQDILNQETTTENEEKQPFQPISTEENQPISTDYINFLKAQIEELKAEKAETEQRLNATIQEKDNIIKDQSAQLADLAQQIAGIANRALITTSQQQYLTAVEKKENIDSPADEVIIETSTEKKEKKSFWKRLFG